MKDYIDKLKELREDNDYSQEYISKLLMINQSNYSKIELKKIRLSIDQLIILCHFYKVTPNYLLGFDK